MKGTLRQHEISSPSGGTHDRSLEETHDMRHDENYQAIQHASALAHNIPSPSRLVEDFTYDQMMKEYSHYNARQETKYAAASNHQMKMKNQFGPTRSSERFLGPSGSNSNEFTNRIKNGKLEAMASNGTIPSPRSSNQRRHAHGSRIKVTTTTESASETEKSLSSKESPVGSIGPNGKKTKKKHLRVLDKPEKAVP